MSRALQAFVYGVPAYERLDGTGVTRERYRLA